MYFRIGKPVEDIPLYPDEYDFHASEVSGAAFKTHTFTMKNCEYPIQQLYLGLDNSNHIYSAKITLSVNSAWIADDEGCNKADGPAFGLLFANFANKQDDYGTGQKHNYPFMRGCYGFSILNVIESTYAEDHHVIVARTELTNEVVVLFRGTVPSSVDDDLTDLHMTTEQCLLSGQSCGSVHSGFWNTFQGVRKELQDSLASIVSTWPSQSFVFVGHSLGGAVATLAALDFTRYASGYDHVRLYTYGRPRVGHSDFADFERSQTSFFKGSYRYVNHKWDASISSVDDPVTILPPYFQHGVDPIPLAISQKVYDDNTVVELVMHYLDTYISSFIILMPSYWGTVDECTPQAMYASGLLVQEPSDSTPLWVMALSVSAGVVVLVGAVIGVIFAARRYRRSRAAQIAISDALTEALVAHP
jgi:hypothetical protein